MERLYDFYLKNICEIPSFLDKYLNTKSIKRLKKVGYFCGMDYASDDVYPFKEHISRFEHSLTVALLTWKYTKDKKATIAALYHDVATPCFSHVIDYMNKDYATQESTEEYTEKIILNDKETINLLEEDNIKPEEIIDFKKYTIVDLDRPKLCADRIDGIILTSIDWTKAIDKETILEILSSLEVYTNEDFEQELGFNNQECYLKVMELNKKIDIYCHSYQDNYMMELLAQITRIAMEDIITYDDLYYLNEEELFDILNKKGNNMINGLLQEFYHIKYNDIPYIEINNIKKRVINPLIKGIRME